MQKCSLVTIRQAKLLKKIGFNEPVLSYIFSVRTDEIRSNFHLSKWNKYGNLYTSLPDVDTVIDWLRKKYNIIVYNITPPSVCPVKGKITFGYGVKLCNIRHGWNGRVYITKKGIFSYNIYAAKRMAINEALKWILSHKSEKSK